jgi:hypothetical protein
MGWCDATIQEPVTDPSWVPSKLAHQFAVAAATSDPAAGTEVLSASDPTEEMDWYSFDLLGHRPELTNGIQPSAFETPVMYPTALRFPGMPTARWWEMDDAAVDLGNVDASDADLARLLVLEYALTYGNDMFVIPLRLTTNTLTTVESLFMLDTFGVRSEIPPAIESGPPSWAAWRMFTLTERFSNAERTRPLLLMLGGLASPIVGDPVDEGQLVRDEMANCTWLIESLYEGDDGFPARRGDVAISDIEPPLPAPPDAPVQWTLSVTPPAHWIPYSSVADASGIINLIRGSEHLVRGQLAQAVPEALPDRLVAREGIRITRRFTHARDPDGIPYVWGRWGRSVGRGETSSGLAFDTLRPRTP